MLALWIIVALALLAVATVAAGVTVAVVYVPKWIKKKTANVPVVTSPQADNTTTMETATTTVETAPEPTPEATPEPEATPPPSFDLERIPFDVVILAGDGSAETVALDADWTVPSEHLMHQLVLGDRADSTAEAKMRAGSSTLVTGAQLHDSPDACLLVPLVSQLRTDTSPLLTDPARPVLLVNACWAGGDWTDQGAATQRLLSAVTLALSTHTESKVAAVVWCDATVVPEASKDDLQLRLHSTMSAVDTHLGVSAPLLVVSPNWADATLRSAHRDMYHYRRLTAALLHHTVEVSNFALSSLSWLTDITHAVTLALNNYIPDNTEVGYQITLQARSPILETYEPEPVDYPGLLQLRVRFQRPAGYAKGYQIGATDYIGSDLAGGSSPLSETSFPGYVPSESAVYVAPHSFTEAFGFGMMAGHNYRARITTSDAFYQSAYVEASWAPPS